jgi:ATP-binding protein involved in chromosome partitioning
VDVPVLGVVENMSVWCCPNCGHVAPIFGAGGGERMAVDYDVPLLGQLPLDLRIREETDGGTPTVAVDPDLPISVLYREIARKVAGRLSVQARNKSIAFPQIVIQG